VVCPDCQTTVEIPKPKPAAKKRSTAPVEEYGLLNKDSLTSKAAANYFLFVCPVCRARLHPSLDQVGTTLICPDCEVKHVVPPPTVMEPAPQEYWREESGEFDMGGTVGRPPAESTYLLVDGTLPPATTPRKRVPDLWFMAGIFGFPFQGLVFVRFLVMSILFTLALGIVVAVMALLTVLFGRPAAGIIMVLFSLPCILLSLLANSYISAVLMAVTSETALGNENVEHWPEGDFREWIWPMLLVNWLILLSGGLTAPIAIPFEWAFGTTVRIIVHIALGLAAFPVLVLSSIESNSAFFPYSPEVLRRIGRNWPSFLIVYVMSLVALGAGTALCWGVYTLVGWPVIFVEVPLAAAMPFIYGRLLGRLGWRITEGENRKKRKRRRNVEATTSAAAAGPA